ncbi:MAG TPA: PaaX family transcriptional regulator C-terminal domain-containing protein [Solirubrobacteraceae bacterium]|jgi:phenylacetic acid degradation operon negative regulatory protein
MASTVGTNGLQPQDLVLTIFGGHVRRPGQTVWSGGMVEILESFGFSTGSARAALARLVNRNLLARTRDGRRAFYSLTQRAEALLADGDRRIFTFGRIEPAVDVWTVLWHAIPETQRVQRARFASRLRFLGFGPVQDATWVAARDREQEVGLLLRQLDIQAYTSVMVGHMSPELPPVALVAQAWRMDEVRRRYEAFIAEFGALRRASARARLAPEQAFRSRILMLHRFRSFPSIDPELPRAVDEVRDLRAAAVGCFDDVYSALEPSAASYFWHIVPPLADQGEAA